MSDGFLPASASAFLVGSIGPLDEVAHHLLELGARQLDLQVLRARASAVRNGRLISVSVHRGQLDLGLLRRLLQALDDHLVLGDVDALVLLELGDQPVHDQLVDVVAAEVRVAVGRHDLDDLLADLEDRDVEGAAAEVVDGDEVVLALVEAVRERCRGRLVDDALDVEAGDAAGVLRGLALGVVEVRRDGDDRLGDLLAQVVLGRLLELLSTRAETSGGGELLAADLDRRRRRWCRARPCRGRASLLA